jgi:hypothetical protein
VPRTCTRQAAKKSTATNLPAHKSASRLIPDLPRMAEEDSSSSLLAAASALGVGTTLSRPAFSTLIDVLGTEVGGDPESTLPKWLQEVSGSTPVVALVLTVARFIKVALTNATNIHDIFWHQVRGEILASEACKSRVLSTTWSFNCVFCRFSVFGRYSSRY